MPGPTKIQPEAALPPAAPGDDGQAGSPDTAGSTRELFPAVYAQLRALAHRQMAHEPADMTLQTTALVHEVYVRLAKDPSIQWESPGQFFKAAGEAMRRILVERARRSATLKRGGRRRRLALEAVAGSPDAVAKAAEPLAMLALDEALTQLRELDGRMAEVVTLRYFAGLSVEETAAALDTSERTVKREWAMARAWLLVRLRDAETRQSPAKRS